MVRLMLLRGCKQLSRRSVAPARVLHCRCGSHRRIGYHEHNAYGSGPRRDGEVHRVNDNLMHWNSNEELVSALVAHDVDFVLIGGLAIAWYCASRQADDMDLLVAPTLENSSRIHDALASLNLGNFAVDSFAKNAVQARIKDRYYAELLTPAAGGPTFDEIAQSAEPASLLGIPVRVPSREMLVRLKLHSIGAKHDGHDKHLADVELLLQR